MVVQTFVKSLVGRVNTTLRRGPGRVNVKLDDLQVTAWQNEGYWIATVASMPGLIAQGDSLDELLEQVRRSKVALETIGMS